MASEVVQQITQSPRLRRLTAYLQAIFEDKGKPLANEELEREIFQDIADLSTLATMEIAKAKAVKEATTKNE